jgi:hypothetical protein
MCGVGLADRAVGVPASLLVGGGPRAREKERERGCRRSKERGSHESA